MGNSTSASETSVDDAMMDAMGVTREPEMGLSLDSDDELDDDDADYQEEEDEEEEEEEYLGGPVGAPAAAEGASGDDDGFQWPPPENGDAPAAEDAPAEGLQEGSDPTEAQAAADEWRHEPASVPDSDAADVDVDVPAGDVEEKDDGAGAEAEAAEVAVADAAAAAAAAEVAEAPIDMSALDWDLVLVTPGCSKAYQNELKEAVEKAGFVTDVFESAALKGDEAVSFLRLAVPTPRLIEFASAQSAPARLEPLALKKACAALDPPIAFTKRAAGAGDPKNKAELGGGHLAAMTKTFGLYPPFLHIYGAVRVDKYRQGLYMPFIAHNRHKLLMRMLKADSALPLHEGKPSPARGAGLIPRLMDQCKPFNSWKADEETGEGPRIATLIVLHDPIDDTSSLRCKIYREWIKGSPWPWKVPVQRLRLYFGDQTGFYFLFLATFTTHCLPIGLVGVLIYGLVKGYQVKEGTTEGLALQLPVCLFAPCMVVAMAIFIADFKRKQTTMAKEWGCFAWTGGKPPVRPRFKGTPQTDTIDGHVTIDWPKSERAKRSRCAWFIIGLFLVVVIFCISAIFYFKWWCLSGQNGVFGAPATGWLANADPAALTGTNLGTLLNVVQVQVLNAAYEGVAVKLTDWENWKTDFEQSNNLIAKLFLFKFVNTFASVFYIAFFKKVVETAGCIGPGGCLDELGTQVSSLFISGGLTSLMLQMVVPMLKKRKIQMKTGGSYGDDDVLRQAARRQFAETEEYDNIEGPIGDYMELAIQFGYLACFGASFAASPFLCFVLAVLQLKQDAYKLLFLNRRPVPMEVRGIGAWETIYEGILKLSVFTNVGMVVFTSRVTDWLDATGKLAVFAACSALGLGALRTVAGAHAPTSHGVALQLQRQATYVDRVVKEVEVDHLFDEAEPEDDEHCASLTEVEHTIF